MHSSRFSPSSSPLPPPFSPSPPQKKEETFYYRNISGEEFIFITVLNKFQKIAAGENYSHYSFILIQKQLACNCNDFVEDGIPIIIDAAFSHSIQVCMCSSGDVNVLQWNRE